MLDKKHNTPGSASRTAPPPAITFPCFLLNVWCNFGYYVNQLYSALTHTPHPIYMPWFGLQPRYHWLSPTRPPRHKSAKGLAIIPSADCSINRPPPIPPFIKLLYAYSNHPQDPLITQQARSLQLFFSTSLPGSAWVLTQLFPLLQLCPCCLPTPPKLLFKCFIEVVIIIASLRYKTIVRQSYTKQDLTPPYPLMSNRTVPTSK